MHLDKRLDRSWEKEKMVGARRFEHPTSSSQNWRSTKLSYAPTKPRRAAKLNIYWANCKFCLLIFLSFLITLKSPKVSYF